jgi:hypothetical protein
MRHVKALALTGVLGLLAAVAHAQAPLLRTIAKHVSQPEFDVSSFRFQCPAGHIPMSFSFTPRMPYEQWLENERSLVDASGAKLARNALTSGPLTGAGVSLNIYNIDCHLKEWVASMNCLSNAASADNAPVLAKASVQAARGATGTAMAFCPADSPVALGGFSNADGTVLQDVVSAPVWGSSGSAQLLADLPDGQTGPPTGWQVKVQNTGMTTVEVDSYAVCGKAPSLQTFVYSATVPPAGAFGTKTAFSIFGPVPDGWTAVGVGADTGTSAQFKALDMWLQDSVVVNMMVWHSTYGNYDSGNAEIRAFMVNALGDAPAGASPRAVMAVLATPKPPPPVTETTIVEFYNASLDHYFITGIAKEISDLDTGVHKGWERTGQTFKAYGIGSAGRAGRRPVCRAYGMPSAGIDSHFYSASPDECTATMVNFGDAWQRPGSWAIEASEVFQMDLPDPVTGACPANDVPIYRVFNQRRDANHRYTTSLAIRDQMVAKGGVAEGYGPNAVALCGLP